MRARVEVSIHAKRDALVRWGAALQLRDVQRRRALHLATWREDGAALVARVLALGADLKARAT